MAIVKLVSGLRMEIDVTPEWLPRSIGIRSFLLLVDEALPAQVKATVTEVRFNYQPSLKLVLIVPEGIDLVALQRLQDKIRADVQEKVLDFSTKQLDKSP